jgi:hypothetical protein
MDPANKCMTIYKPYSMHQTFQDCVHAATHTRSRNMSRALPTLLRSLVGAVTSELSLLLTRFLEANRNWIRNLAHSIFVMKLNTEHRQEYLAKICPLSKYCRA